MRTIDDKLAGFRKLVLDIYRISTISAKKCDSLYMDAIKAYKEEAKNSNSCINVNTAEEQ